MTPTQLFGQYGVTNFYYVTVLNNLASILTHGILCRNDALKYSPTDISLSDVQVKRERNYQNYHLREGRKASIHDYVPLFFADNTPMLYTCVEKSDEVILLEINFVTVIHCNGVLFSDGNVANAESNLFDYPNEWGQLANLDWNVVFSRSGAKWPKWKRIRSAEVLIPSICPTYRIDGIYFQGTLENGWTRIGQILDSLRHRPPVFVESGLSKIGIMT